MVPLLDGKSKIGAHLRSNIVYSICLRPLMRWRAVTNRNLFSLRKYLFSFMRAQSCRLISNIRLQWAELKRIRNYVKKKLNQNIP